MADQPGVLVTRPRGQAVGLCEGVAAAGYRVCSQPLLELRALPELAPTQRQLLIDLDRFHHVIFVSANAVQFGMSWIGDYWPQLPLGLSWYAIGEATARMLRSYGIEAITPAATMTSEGLLAEPALGSVDGERILIIKGEGGRTTLRDELGKRGGLVDELACYRRLCPDLEPGELARLLANQHIQLVMISSGEGLGNLLALLSPAETTTVTNITLLVPSQRIARMARAARFDKVITAENASDSAMLRALEDWQPSAGECE